MNRILKAFGLLSLIAVFTACKKDDGANVAPPRDYAVQYATEKADIENYLKSHYMTVDPATFDVTFAEIQEGGSQVSIWDQTEYPLQSKIVNSNDVDYTVYYITLNEGVGDSPTRADNVLTAYRGELLDGTQFDYTPYPQNQSSLMSSIEGWQEIIPLFKTGEYIDIPNDPNPASFQNFGAGIMFLPSGLGYYNSPRGLISAYDSLIFTFKLYDLEYTDLDNDGILNKDETEPGIDLNDYDTDGDETPNYLDIDDDGDGYLTIDEIKIPGSDPAEYYEFDAIPTCTGGTVKRHLDPTCHN
ncbi:FKBP-type peptidylprolyl isomerase [Flavobacterium sp. MFBS3-15]|uniref:FKBP-type peptidyl-prolyl cis-trans isomerase n=1 Tax=Flavobacterium sp. MFBS3-15 TaxID=2989816 RepID=UPI002235773A|nr:FKBP-type peptidylprolyl isomerase [Flavobacterium sp. MFBS3-15]MCW4468336.1 FKBP-type peptidylprolyl isomerase [Flavobacterium sp. MFBS3-15]